MHTKTSHKFALRATLVAAALAAALSANAWIIAINGTINSSGGITGTTYQFSDLTGLNNTFIYSFGVDSAGAIGATISNGTSLLSLVNTAGTNVSHFNNNTFSYSGEWTATSIANLPIKNTGTYSGIFDYNGGNFAVQFAGAPVPEPAPIAALSIGALALLRRRRRS